MGMRWGALGPESLGLNITGTFFPRTLKDKKMLYSQVWQACLQNGAVEWQSWYFSLISVWIIGPNILLTWFSLCLTLLTPFSPDLLLSFVLFLHFFLTFHISLFLGRKVTGFFIWEKVSVIFNCDHSRNQSRSVLCSKYTKECISFRVNPFPGNILAVCQKEHYFPMLVT